MSDASYRHAARLSKYHTEREIKSSRQPSSRRTHFSGIRRPALAAIVAATVVTAGVAFPLAATTVKTPSSSSFSPADGSVFESHRRRHRNRSCRSCLGDTVSDTDTSDDAGNAVVESSSQYRSDETIDAANRPVSSSRRLTAAAAEASFRRTGRRECLATLISGGASGAAVAGAIGWEERVWAAEDTDSSPLPSTLSAATLIDDHSSSSLVSAPTEITFPLEAASGGTFCIRCTVFADPTSSPVDENRRRFFFGSDSSEYDVESFRVYRAIVDTGSPYLVLPSPTMTSEASGRRQRGRGQTSSPSFVLSDSEYPPTEEIYGVVKGRIDWKSARFAFRDPRLAIAARKPIVGGNGDVAVVGVLDDLLTAEATGGGTTKPYALVGLIRDVNPNADRGRFPDPRPTFLEQERLLPSVDNIDTATAATSRETTTAEPSVVLPEMIRSFAVDGPGRELTLSSSSSSLVPAASPAMPLVDLRTYGDFVDHYAVLVESVSFDDADGSGTTVVTAKDLVATTGSTATVTADPPSSPRLERRAKGGEPKRRGISNTTERPIVAVFDTGLTGCLLTRPFWNALKEIRTTRAAARGIDVVRDEDPSDDATMTFRSVDVSVEETSSQDTERGLHSDRRINAGGGQSNRRPAAAAGDPRSALRRNTIGASVDTSPRLFYVGPIDLDWFDDDDTAPYVIVLGQAFLGRGVLAVDMDGRRATFALGNSV